MRNKAVIFFLTIIFSIFSFIPNTGYAQTPEILSQQEIEHILGNKGTISPTSRVTTLDELKTIENYYKKVPNAKKENIRDILEKLNLEDVEIIPVKEIDGLNDVSSIQPMNILPNFGSVEFRNISHSSKLFYASLYATNIGVDSIDQIGGKLYGYAILPNTSYYTLVLSEFFNETYIKPFIDRKIGDFNIAHFKNKAKFVADYVVKEGSQVVNPSPASVIFNGIN